MKSIVLFTSILRIVMIAAIMSFAVYANAQNVAINASGNSADASAMLDVSSSSKGFLAPRMTTAQRVGIPSPANGLMVFDTDTKSYWYFSQIWKEINNAGGGSFSLPYAGSFSDPAKVFAINNTNTGGGSVAVYGKSGNTGSGITPGVSMGLWGDNSSGIGVVGTSIDGVGTYGLSFQNHGVSGYSTNISFAGIFGSHANAGPGVLGESGSGGIGVYGRVTGVSGKAGFFENTNNTGTDTVFKVVNNGTGVSGYFTNPNVNSTGALISGDHYGKGSGIFMKLWNAQNNNPGFYMYQYGNGDGLYVGSNKSKAARFYSNAGNPDTSVAVINDGAGSGLHVNITSGVNNSSAISIVSNGTGHGLQSIISNASSGAAAIYGNSSGAKGVHGVAQNNGVIGQTTASTGGIGVLGIASVSSIDGIGVKGISNSNHNQSLGAVTGINNSDGIAVYGQSTSGIAIVGKSNNNFGPAIFAENQSAGGYGIRAQADGNDGIGLFVDGGVAASTSSAALLRNVNAFSDKVVVEVANMGTGEDLYIHNNNYNSTPMIHMRNQGSGSFILLEDDNAVQKFLVAKSGSVQSAGHFTIQNETGYPAGDFRDVVDGNSEPVLKVSTTSASNNDLAVFAKGNANAARINAAGKGFFNGGTQTGGADMAEAFDVDGNRNEYEPGDVLIISTNKDRTVVKSSTAYSTLVAGVYATKPGVLMTEENIDTDISDKVPMGVVGVIPTKVCLEGGEIKRGDLLVTSSITGVAMKADIEKVKPGQVIGKALENYSATDIGKIKVLVNVK